MRCLLLDANRDLRILRCSTPVFFSFCATKMKEEECTREEGSEKGNRQLGGEGDKRNGSATKRWQARGAGAKGNRRLMRGGDKRDGGSDQEVASEGSGRTGNRRLMRGGDKRDGGSDQVVVSEGSGRKR